MLIKKVVIAVIFLCASGLLLTAQSPDTDAILARLDELNSFGDTDFSAEYTIVTEKPGEERSVFRVRSFRRDREDKFTMVILEPRVRRGEGYLQIGDTAWSYDPESREFAIFSMRENFQDSSARTSDFTELTLSANYEVDSAEADTLGRYDVWVLDLRATSDRVTFPRVKIWVRQDNYLALKEENYSLSDRRMRTVLYPSYSRIGERYVAQKILIVDDLNEGERTEITVREISFSPLSDNVFTRGYLERIGR
ncbi:MAG: outer membrane lipoprotein-sorting protein [Spirochaeta sp.]